MADSFVLESHITSERAQAPLTSDRGGYKPANLTLDVKEAVHEDGRWLIQERHFTFMDAIFTEPVTVGVPDSFDYQFILEMRRAVERDERRRKVCMPVPVSSAGCLLGTHGCEVEHADLDSPLTWALKDVMQADLHSVLGVARRRWGWNAGLPTEAKDRDVLALAYDEMRRLQREGYAEIVHEADGGMATRGLDVWRWTGG